MTEATVKSDTSKVTRITSSTGRPRRTTAQLLLVAMLFAAPQVAHAEHAAAEAGMGVLSVASSLIWGTAKTLYALVGGATGGLAWALTGGRTDVAKPIWTSSLRGDYVVTPDHLRGKEGLVFLGREDYTSGSEAYSGNYRY
jgi:hypothetical protein